MKKSSVNYAKIDNGIKDLVRRLDEIPFVTTLSSCEGHLKDFHDHAIVPDEGCRFLYSGDMIFNLDKTHSQAPTFLKDVKKLEERYSFVNLYEHHCGDTRCDIEGSYILSLDYYDLVEPLKMEEDSLEAIIKKMHQVKTLRGQQRIAEYKKVWADFLDIAEKY